MYTVIELCKLRARCWQHAGDANAVDDEQRYWYWSNHAMKLTAMIAS